MSCKLYFKIVILSFIFLLSEKTIAQSPEWLWAKSIGDTNKEFGFAIVTDVSGNIYTTGNFRGTVDFDPGPGTAYLTAEPIGNIFVSKFDNSGNLIWAKAMGGIGYDVGNSIALDALDNVYITGSFSDTVDFDPGAGTYNLNSVSGYPDNFVCKLDSMGNFMWAKSTGGAFNENTSSIAIDASSNVYTTGYFEGTADFDPDSTGVYNLTSIGPRDIFISKLNTNGNFIWAKSIGGQDSIDSRGYGLTLDVNGNVYTTGYFSGTDDFDPDSIGVFNLTSAGLTDIFISKLDSSGNFIWARTMGGPDYDYGISITTDASGNVYTTGGFVGTVDFNPDSTINFDVTSAGLYDIFINKLDGAGNFVWTKTFGDTLNDDSRCIAVDASGDVYTTGSFIGTIDFAPGTYTYDLTSVAGSQDIFISKLDSSGNYIWAKAMGGTSGDICYDLAFDASGDLYATGAFVSTSISFDSFGLTNADSTGQYDDMFIAKLGHCYAHFTLYPDTIPHNWFALNQAIGVAPITYAWMWGDSTISTGATPSHTYNAPGNYNICLSITDAEGCISNYCDSSTYIFKRSSNSMIINLNVVTQLTTNTMDQNGYEKGSTVFPNPATNYFTIAFEINQPNVTAIISDLTGKIIYATVSAEGHQIEINTTDFPEGIYIVQIKSDDFVETKRLIIEK